MTINNPDAFCAGLWDWSILDGCFGETKIKPTDVDGFVERHGKFLWLETKAPGASIPHGQMLTFLALQKLQVFTIMVIWGEKNAPVEIQLMTRHEIRDKEKCDVTKLQKLVSNWYKYADFD